MKKFFILPLMAVLFIFSFLASADAENTREGILTFNIDLHAHAIKKKASLWIPFPVSDENQVIENMGIESDAVKTSLYRDEKDNALYLYAEWDKTAKDKKLSMKFKVRSKERKVENFKESKEAFPDEVKKYLEPNWWIPTDGKIKKIADKITKDKKTVLEKAKAVYNWTVKNTYRDPNVKGCGAGIVEQTLTSRGGKCADISSVFVAIARAAGIPSREIFGIRLSKKDSQDMTKGYHCWAEFFLPGTGWVPVDPADVRKMMLVKKLNLKQADHYYKYFFGAVEQFRIMLGKAERGVTLIPRQKGGAINYFMYPYAEIDGTPLDYYDPSKFSYSVSFKAL